MEEELDLMHSSPPAHDLVRQQHSAHLWVLVLAFIDDRLQETPKETTIRHLEGTVTHVELTAAR